MNTQSYLFDVKESIPEGIYLELMNKLKIDFDNPPPKKVKPVPYKKSELLIIIGQKSITWTNRDIVLSQIAKLNMTQLKSWCKRNNIPITKPI
jgi:hypothetical protein